MMPLKTIHAKMEGPSIFAHRFAFSPISTRRLLRVVDGSFEPSYRGGKGTWSLQAAGS
jgi:hypothetical protein